MLRLRRQQRHNSLSHAVTLLRFGIGGALYKETRRERDRGPALYASFGDAEGECATEGQKTEECHERQHARCGWQGPVRRYIGLRRRRRRDYLGQLPFPSPRRDCL